MDNNVASINPSRDLADFFDFMYGNQDGYVYLPTKDPASNEWKQDFFQWPAQREDMIHHVLSESPKREVYFGPALYKQPASRKEFIKGSYVLWAEFDGKVPESWGDIPLPTLRVRSSEPGHEHVYWKLDYFEVDVDTIERANRGLTYSLGADTSGWDANQILRPVASFNHKRNKPVHMVSKNSNLLSVEFFAGIPEPKQSVRETISLEEIPDTLDVIAKFVWDDEAFTFFRKPEIPVGSRSSAMMRLAFYCAEMRMSDEEAFSVINNADQRWGKFKHRRDRVKRIIDLINKARLKFPLNPTGESIEEFPIYDFESLLATDIQIDWMIPGILQQAGMALLSGPPGTGKTQLTLQFCIHMALGKPFLGWEITEPRRMVFFSMEMGHADIKYFLEYMVKDLTEEERELLRQNFFIVPLGYSVLLDSPVDQRKVTDVVERYAPDGIIFDSLGTSTNDELSSEGTVKKIFDYLDRVRDNYSLFVWFIHHNRKAQGNNKKPNKLSDIYGSQYITAKATTVIGLWPLPNGNIEISGLKVRLSAPFSTLVARRTQNLNFVVGSALSFIDGDGNTISADIPVETYDDGESDYDF